MIISELENIWLSFHNYRKGNRMKKTFNLLLSASMVLGLASPIYAQEGTFVEVAETTATTETTASTKDELVKAVTDAKDGDTIKLTKDIVLEDTLSITITSNKNITLDLNGKNLTLKEKVDKALMNISVNEGNTFGLVLTDSAAVKGKIESAGNASAICVGKGVKMVTRNINIVFSDKTEGEANAANLAFKVEGELTVEAGTNISSTEGGIYILGQNAKLIFNDGNIDSQYYAVSGNGSKGKSGTNITINGGALKASSGAGIYHPQDGTLTLNGGTITGLTGVQMCAGDLVVPETSTVKVIATGEDDRANKTGDGNIDDGSAISLVNRNYPGGAPKANIAGGSFVSNKVNETILAYSWNSKAEGEQKYPAWEEAKNNTTVSGGEFNKPFDAEFVKEKTSFLSVDGTYYAANEATLKNLVANAEESIVILKNVKQLTGVPGGVKVENKTENKVTVNGTEISKDQTINIPTSNGGGATVKLNPVYRAYNPNNGEHLYTLDEKEYKHVASVGWDAEGVAFMAEEEKNGQVLYRVYNPNSGLHHYTLDEKEKNTLVSLGWHDEKVAWYTSKKPQSAPVFRVYNPNDGNHHYTMNKQEKDVLVSYGWQDEGLAFRTAPIEK